MKRCFQNGREKGINMIKNRINVRENSISDTKLQQAITHNYRLDKNELKNVDYNLLFNNYSSLDLDVFRKKIREEKARHNKLYKETFGRNIRNNLVNSFKELLITFPKEFGEKIKNKEITQEQLLKCIDTFKEEIEAQTGTKVLLVQLHQDEPESSPHFHIILTNFRNENGKTFKQKGYYSWLQDIAGFSFSDLGLIRGISKKITKERNVKSTKWREMVHKQGHSLEKALLTEAVSLDNIDDYISMAVKPFKTILIYLKRSLNTEKEGVYIKQQHQRALNNFNKNYPGKNINNIEELVEEITQNIKKYKTKGM